LDEFFSVKPRVTEINTTNAHIGSHHPEVGSAAAVVVIIADYLV